MFGIGKQVVESAGDLLKARENSKLKRLELADARHERELNATSKAIERAATANGLKGLWRPILMIVLTFLVTWHAVQTFIMVGTFFWHARFGGGPGLSSDERYLLSEWLTFGASLVLVLGAFGGVTSWSRGKEKIAGKAASSVGVMDAVRDNLDGVRPDPVVERKPMAEAPETIERMDGIVVPEREIAVKSSEPLIDEQKFQAATFAAIQPAAPPVSQQKNYFSDEELECHGKLCNCEFPGMHPDVMDMANDLREHFGLPVIVTSAFRCPEHNASVGGAKDSFHTKAMAMDVKISGVTPTDIYDYLNNKYPRKYGLGLYRTFVHFDCRHEGWARKSGPDVSWRWHKKPDVQLS